MMSYIKIILYSLVFLCILPLNAQEVLTKKRAIEIALENNYGVKTNQALQIGKFKNLDDALKVSNNKKKAINIKSILFLIIEDLHKKS